MCRSCLKRLSTGEPEEAGRSTLENFVLRTSGEEPLTSTKKAKGSGNLLNPFPS